MEQLQNRQANWLVAAILVFNGALVIGFTMFLNGFSDALIALVCILGSVISAACILRGGTLK